MAIHEARNDDPVRGVDHLSARGRKVRADRGNRLALDQHVAGCQIADLRIERDDRAAFEKQALTRIERLRRREALLCRRRAR